MKSLFDELIVVEFSLSQKCFHKQTLWEMVKTNQENMMRRKQTDYIPVAVFRTNEQADEFILKTKEVIKDYSMYKNIEGETVVN